MPTPSLDLDFTTGSLPSRAVFSRAGSRLAFGVAGALASLSNDVPAYEYNSSLACLGISVNDALTNLVLHSNDITNGGFWGTSGAPTFSTNQPGPDGTNSAVKMIEAVGSNSFTIFQSTAAIVSGNPYCAWALVKAAERVSMRLDIGDNPYTVARLNLASGEFYTHPNTWTNVTGGCKPVGNSGWFLVWVAGTANGTTGRVRLYLCDATGAPTYVGDGTSGLYVHSLGLNTGTRPSSCIITVGATVSVLADLLKITDLSWFSAAQGTFVIDHDATSGVILGSGANTLLSAIYPTRGAPGRSAVAYDGAQTVTVHNGGSASTGAAPTFGADITIMGNSAVRAGARVRRLRWYNTKLSTADMQSITAATATPGTAGALRTVSQINKLPNNTFTLTTQRTFASRMQHLIGSADATEIRLSFSNFLLGSGGESTPGNSYDLDEVALEIGATSVPVRFAGVRNKTLADGDVDIQSDAVLPAAFGLTSFARGTTVWVRMKGKVASSGHKLPIGRDVTEYANQQFLIYDPAATTVSATDATGVFTQGGAAAGAPTIAFSSIMLGRYGTQDPKTFFNLGDSITDQLLNFTARAEIDADLAANPFSCIQCAVGGAGVNSYLTPNTRWESYVKYARVGVHALGANNIGFPLESFHYMDIGNRLYALGIEKLAKTKITPRTTSTDNWVTEANETYSFGGAGGTLDLENRFLLEQVTEGYQDIWAPLTSVEGVDPFKWIVDGVTANYSTIDGTHPSVQGRTLMGNDLRPILAAITVAAPAIPDQAVTLDGGGMHARRARLSRAKGKEAEPRARAKAQKQRPKRAPIYRHPEEVERERLEEQKRSLEQKPAPAKAPKVAKAVAEKPAAAPSAPPAPQLTERIAEKLPTAPAPAAQPAPRAAAVPQQKSAVDEQKEQEEQQRLRRAAADAAVTMSHESDTEFVTKVLMPRLTQIIRKLKGAGA